MRDNRRNNAATLIQSEWRSHDCQVSFWQFLAAILTIQCYVRRWSAQKLVGNYQLEGIEAPEAAAWVAVGRTALNLDELITRE